MSFLKYATTTNDANYMHINLVPKVYNPKNMTQLNPISILQCFVKNNCKILINRLRCVILDVMSKNQNVFIPWNFISDNILVPHGLFYTLKTKRQGHLYNMDLKG